jgi:hypothetical protein
MIKMVKVFGYVELNNEGQKNLGIGAGPYPVIDLDPHFGVEILDHQKLSHWIMKGQFSNLEKSTLAQKEYEIACGQGGHVHDVQSMIDQVKSLVDIQGSPGNWDVSPAMCGMFNGMEMILSILEKRDPVFRSVEQKTTRDEDVQDRLFDRVMQWTHDNRITCEETIHQCDWVIQDAYEFMEDLFKIVEPFIPKSDEDDE